MYRSYFMVAAYDRCVVVDVFLFHVKHVLVFNREYVFLFPFCFVC